MDWGLQRWRRRVSVLVALLVGCGVWGVTARAADAAPLTELESVSSSDAQGNDGSAGPVVTPNGRWVAFSSYATNLTTPAPMGDGDVYVRDRETGVTQLIDQGLTGQGGDDGSGYPQISNDGRYVAFVSDADNLVSGVSGWHIYRFDRSSETLIALPVPSGEAAVDYPSMSADGSEIAFDGFASVGGILGLPSGNTHVYVWSAPTGAVTEEDSTAAGTVGSGTENDEATLSADGSTVAFQTNSPNLTPGDTSGHADVVEKNLSSGAVTLVSVGAGTQVNGDSSYPVVDGNGCVVAFDSTATNLVSGDTVSGTKVFDRDVCSGATEFASITNTGTPITADVQYYGVAPLAISDNGCLIAYTSTHTTPAPSSGSGAALRDRCNGVTTRVDVTSAGDPSAGGVLGVSISHGSGRYVAFTSSASDLVGNDTNGENDAFLRDTDLADTPPVAALSTSTSGLTVTADASASNDPDGFVLTSSIAYGDGTTQSGVHGSHTYAQAGTYGVTVTVTDADGASSSTTSVVTVSAPSSSPSTGSGAGSTGTGGTNSGGSGGTGTGGSGTGGGGTSTPAPAVRLSGLSLTHHSFAPVTATSKPNATHGSTLGLVLNTAATVTLTYARVETGRRLRGSCHANAAKGPRCVLYVTVGSSRSSLSTGKHLLTLTGVVGHRALMPGTYRLTVTAISSGHISTGHIQFTILKEKRR